MGGTLNYIYHNISNSLATQMQAMTRLQEQVSTGSKINRLSDDIAAAYQVLELNNQERNLDNYIDNVEKLISTLEYSSTVIDDMASNITHAQTLLTQVVSGTYSAVARERTADEINEILEQMLMLANSRYMGQSLYGGANASVEPFVAERTGGEITNVTYQGSSSRQIEVADGLDFTLFQAGDEIFSSNDREEPVFYGNTGARGGTGTSSVTGDTWLTVTNSATGYILSVDGGLSTFETDGTDTNLAVTSSQTGEVLYVDTTEISQQGLSLVRVPGTYNIFNALISIRDVLRNEQGLSGAELSELNESTFNMLAEISSRLVQNQEVTGSQISLLDNLQGSLENQKYNAQERTAGLQAADVTQIAIDLSLVETLYQMSLSVAAKLMTVSLLDYL